MFYRITLCRLFVPVVFLCLNLFSATARSASEPAFWVVNKGASTVYLFGSMHFGRRDFYPLPDRVEQDFADSSKLVVEVNLLQLGTDAQQIVFRHAGLPAGKNLEEVLNAETYAALKERAEFNKIPISAFQRFQPWYVTLTLVEAEIRKTELQQQLGLDLYFLRRAQALEKPVEELETLDSQLGLFSSISLRDQEKFLRQTLADLQNSQGYLSAAADAWVQGDVALLDKTLIEPFREQEEAKVLFETMFTQRNVKMADAVVRFLNTNAKTFVVVGVGHMLGDDGIVALLKARGLSVRKIDTGTLKKDPTDSVAAQSATTGLP